MDKKQIQKERMKKYFIEAAKEIIKEEGIKGVTARKVGDKAGYSYATIYNYFEDLNVLLNYCVFDFLEDCYQHMMLFSNKRNNAKDQIITYALEYFKYFAHHPEMFQLVFLENFGPIPDELMNEMKPSVGLLLKENLIACANEGYIAYERVNLLHGLIGSSIHGKLLFYIKKRHGELLGDALSTIEKEIEHLIEKEMKA